MGPGSLGWGAAALAAMTTLAPSRAARSAIASPIPRLAPVMNRVLPVRLAMAGTYHRTRRGRSPPRRGCKIAARRRIAMSPRIHDPDELADSQRVDTDWTEEPRSARG